MKLYKLNILAQQFQVWAAIKSRTCCVLTWWAQVENSHMTSRDESQANSRCTQKKPSHMSFVYVFVIFRLGFHSKDVLCIEANIPRSGELQNVKHIWSQAFWIRDGRLVILNKNSQPFKAINQPIGSILHCQSVLPTYFPSCFYLGIAFHLEIILLVHRLSLELHPRPALPESLLPWHLTVTLPPGVQAFQRHFLQRLHPAWDWLAHTAAVSLWSGMAGHLAWGSLQIHAFN